MARAHEWMEDACLRCGLHRREEWVLDGRGRTVMALVWTDRTGDRRIQPFPPMKGVEPPRPVVGTLEEVFPGLPVGPEPPCGSTSLVIEVDAWGTAARSPEAERSAQPKRPEM
jgi:hypothetical protein